MFNFRTLTAFSSLAFLIPGGSFAADPVAQPDFFAAALCEPSYTFGLATQLYEAAEKIGSPDTSMLGAAIYTLPTPIKRDGFTASAVVFAGTSVGVLVDGEVAEEAAQRYHLAKENNNLLGASKRGFSRELPDQQQAMKDLGLISAVAREGAALQDKTLLACEFVSHEDRMALQRLKPR
ncbi:MAG: hypothetical protein QM681_00180 [Novosphingobium sp.]